MRVLSPVLLLLILCFSSCDLVRSDEDQPIFLEIQDIELQTQPAQGENTHKIRDAWIVANGQDVGVFELPVTVPLIDEPPIDIRVFAGVRQNGMESFPIEYPFYSSNVFTVDAAPLATVSKDLSVEYIDITNFELVEDFEVANAFNVDLDDFEGSYADIEEDPADPENFAGVLYADEENPVVEVGTGILFNGVDIIGRKPYLELDYKSDVPFTIGVRKFFGNVFQKEYIIVLKEKEEWNHLYLSLQEYLADSGLQSYQILLNMDLNGLDAEEGRVYIDNLKLIRF